MMISSMHTNKAMTKKKHLFLALSDKASGTLRCQMRAGNPDSTHRSTVSQLQLSDPSLPSLNLHRPYQRISLVSSPPSNEFLISHSYTFDIGSLSLGKTPRWLVTISVLHDPALPRHIRSLSSNAVCTTYHGQDFRKYSFYDRILSSYTIPQSTGQLHPLRSEKTKKRLLYYECNIIIISFSIFSCVRKKNGKLPAYPPKNFIFATCPKSHLFLTVMPFFSLPRCPPFEILPPCPQRGMRVRIWYFQYRSVQAHFISLTSADRAH